MRTFVPRRPGRPPDAAGAENAYRIGMESASGSSVSVVVPSKNRPAEIARMLASLRAQPTAPLEVIVIDQSEPRYTIAEFPGLVHVHAPHLTGLTAARNAGVALACGKVVQFFDDDVELDSDCVRFVAEAFANRPELVGAQCTIHNPWDDEPFGLHQASSILFERGFFNSRPRRERGDIVPRLIDGLASAYRRSIFERERFDEQLPGYGLAEDWDFTKRASRHGRLIVINDARVRHLPSQNNRYDVQKYLDARWNNILYLYDKLNAGGDVRNRLWRRWWMIGEGLRAVRTARRLRSLR
jgi:GT2 family glycosyltransferase